MSNNLKLIREIYGATQEEIAKVAGVTRSTVSQWETGSSRASNTKLEKLSIFYGIGPEYFYEYDSIPKDIKDLLVSSANREKEVKEHSKIERDKASELAEIMDGVDFISARRIVTATMKLMLAAADTVSLEELILAYEIYKKMLKRFEAVINLRKMEEEDREKSDAKTLFELLDETK